MSGAGVEIGFVAALEREVRGIVRGWGATEEQGAIGRQRIYRSKSGSGKAALICAGTGVDRAYAAAKLLIEKYSPRVLVSIGFAGACVEDLAPGSIVVPAAVVESATGKSCRCAFGRGTLVTLDRVAGKGLKQCTLARFGGVAVDMEAAGVAAAAAEAGREFAAIKAISDGAAEDLGFLSDFVRPEGFATGRFIAHIALRPGLWASVAALQRNSRTAALALESAVAECIEDRSSFAAKHSPAVTQV